MNKQARISLLAAAAIAGIFAFWGGFTRRWMSDDGLIVLRTVRNLLAGNGPVFNIGERVEANTSVLWQYLITAFGWLTGARLEDVAMWLALACTVIGAVVATVGSGRFWDQNAATRGVVLPFGILIYLALPPARDFATSGLEWGLCIMWLAVWWALLVQWAGPIGRRALPVSGYWLAFWCGLSWLVRPELALYGGVTGIVLLAYSPRKWAGILAAALPVPAAYQLFRMGFYGLLTPHTAVAKSASDAEWARGGTYFWDFVGYYWLWLPLLVVAGCAVWLLRGARGRRLAIVLLTAGCALVHVLYVLRVGGDFMHGRMLLLPLFALLLPMMTVPLTRVTIALTLAATVFAGVTIVRAHPIDWFAYERGEKELNIVDEREFWSYAIGQSPADPPRHAEDFLGSKLMESWTEAVENGQEHDAGQLNIARLSTHPDEYSWYWRPRMDEDEAKGSDLLDLPTTAYLTNLGMTSMNAPLEMRVLDSVGLATPLAARMPRDPEGRVGHDKYLPMEWQVADSATKIDSMPKDVDREQARAVRAALREEPIADLLASSREPMSWHRFWENVQYSLGDGRSLQLEQDPTVYLSDETMREIKKGKDPGVSGTQIAWPVN
ncbi:hypothetical protein CKJ80_02880 [Corynebacterium hadale]|uniref:Terminal beta-(1->2)-arabinofuranosyltransferase C-terminal domain-containing protein n=1 Tax=Corynebacterium hadale TaxID=2026255 RepID=A0AB36RN05_9CORY|nr:hypothetical protein [Corynebacterium hadale]PAT11122.1 hypothetical protein CKJ80_02880 [Corynebacterium hadale]